MRLNWASTSLQSIKFWDLWVQGHWFSHLTQLRNLILHNTVLGSGVRLFLSHLPASLRNLSVSDATIIIVVEVLCAANEQLTVHLEANTLTLREFPTPNHKQNTGLTLQLACLSMCVPTSEIYVNTSLHKEAAKSLMHWVRCSGANIVSVASTYLYGFPRFYLHESETDIEYTNCKEFAKCLNDAQALYFAPVPPVFACKVIESSVDVFSVCLERIPCHGI